MWSKGRGSMWDRRVMRIAKVDGGVFRYGRSETLVGSHERGWH